MGQFISILSDKAASFGRTIVAVDPKARVISVRRVSTRRRSDRHSVSVGICALRAATTSTVISNAARNILRLGEHTRGRAGPSASGRVFKIAAWPRDSPGFSRGECQVPRTRN